MAEQHDIAPRAVVFDMDGLLLDSEVLSMEALVLAGRDLGMDLPDAFCRSLIGLPLDQCRVVIGERYGAGLPLDRYIALHAERLAEIVATGRLALKRGARELLDVLDRRHLPRAIATSSNRVRAMHHLELVGITDRFDAIVTRDDVSRGKPHPEPFLTAAARLGVRPADCLALEDSHNGVRAAHAAGMRVIMVPDLLTADDDMRAMAWRIETSLHGVAEWLASLGPADI